MLCAYRNFARVGRGALATLSLMGVPGVSELTTLYSAYKISTEGVKWAVLVTKQARKANGRFSKAVGWERHKKHYGAGSRVHVRG